MSLKGFGRSLAVKDVQTDLKYAGELSAGAALMLGSVANTLQLASQAISHVLDWDVSFAGISVSEQLLGVEVTKTKSTDPCRVRELAPGDLIRTDQLLSAGATGNFDGTKVPNTAVGVDHATGKFRIKQAYDVEIARIAPEGNFYDTDGSVWLEITALK